MHPARVTLRDIIRFCLTFGMLLGAAADAGAAAFSDSAGRAVPVPERVTKVFPAGPPAGIFLYMLAPDLMAGWTRSPRPDERDLMPQAYAHLPEIGRLTGRGGSANLETVLASKPDLILDYGSLRPTYISLADRVQAQTGIPYVLIDGSFDQIPAAFRATGNLIGRPAEGEAKAREAERILADLAAVRQSLSVGSSAPRVYYGRGADGLRTGVGGSINSELLKYAGAVNVAEEVASSGNLASVSMEQVLAWNPDVILTTDPNFYERVWSDEVWATLGAVKAGRVYLSPTLPFGWFDRPPSANRLIGLRWLLAVLYPDRFAGELEPETRAFYRTFYHLELTDAQLAKVLGPGTRPGTGRSK
ncbi:iron ABC transporter substrate-binding protein [Nisaea sediminum]|uniref:iron ABC transporter substrate-binding protein n=1 Tax=Nisaea sediminum TaxID=2775867 RepID=UPI001D02BF5A|nr:iron ABC transporter substrate-binding protein [Nisaea sediminum]